MGKVRKRIRHLRSLLRNWDYLIAILAARKCWRCLNQYEADICPFFREYTNWNRSVGSTLRYAWLAFRCPHQKLPSTLEEEAKVL
ncbi:MAG: hypothetical protein ABIH46_11640 [Chloroflexota bacterium]